jgi:TRAP-type C4-dicarboxylate transport system permease small subunit
MSVYKKIMDVIAGIEKVILSVVLVFVTVITFANVLVRKLTDSQFAWTEEMVINLFVLMIMLGCALCAREGSLISLSLIFDRLKTGGKKVLVLIITAANTAFWILLLKTGIDKVLTQMANGKHTFSLDWPEWVFTIFLPIGCVFLILHTIEFCIDFMTDNEPSVKPQEKEEGGND